MVRLFGLVHRGTGRDVPPPLPRLRSALRCQAPADELLDRQQQVMRRCALKTAMDTLKLVRPTNLVGPYRQARPSGCTTPLH